MSGLFAAFLLVAAAQADDAGLDDRVRLEVSVSSPTPFVGEVVEARVRLVLREGFRRGRLVQSFRRKLDVPVQLHLATPSDEEGLVPIEVERPSDGAMLVVDGSPETARAVPADPGWEAFEVRRSFLAARPGTFALAPPRASFEHAEAFTESFLDGRVPIDPERAEVASTEIELEVRELPVVGRPPEFHGAVGSFTVASRLAARAGRVGEPIEWTFTVGGRGNLAFLDPPALERQLADFHLRGRIERAGEAGREYVHELVPLRPLEGFPGVEFVWFDPKDETYRTARTEPLALTIEPAADGVELAPAPAPVVADSPDETPTVVPEPEERRGLGPLMSSRRASYPVHAERLGASELAAVLGAPWGLLLCFAVARRLRERGRVDPAVRRAREAHAAFRERLEYGVAPSEALAEYLGARLHLTAAAVVDLDLAERLERAGIARELADETARVQRELLDEHFSRGAEAESTGEVAGLVERLEPAFESTEVEP